MRRNGEEARGGVLAGEPDARRPLPPATWLCAATRVSLSRVYTASGDSALGLSDEAKSPVPALTEYGLALLAPSYCEFRRKVIEVECVEDMKYLIGCSGIVLIIKRI